ncbi:type II CRISPR-associated endonuclease Cas1 [Bifidobacterium dentium]|uniref:type II CRISPR-associated endonuclease Cas1 n=1 Tax=Bifidobacterium dentium TaxID=1689 RepID=UPI001899105B|nr:type II CRISPR-associated endonuclease Cas1 [Bifidobacterium dentium]
MAWRNVVVTQHCKISVKMKLLIVQTDDELFQFPIDDIGMLMVATTHAVITSNAMASLLKRDIKVVFCDEKHLPVGETNPYKTESSRRSCIVQQMNWSDERKGSLWQRIIREKIAHQIAVLEEEVVCQDIEKMKRLIPSVKFNDSDNREAVAAHMYFPRLFSYEFVRSDDENTINGMLNYGYAILLSEVSRKIAENGYLTEFGIHHDSEKNPFNLACDLMEPFRPFVDKKVFEMKLHSLDTDAKTEFVKMMRTDLPEFGTTITQLINVYVRDALRYLVSEERLPELGFVQ